MILAINCIYCAFAKRMGWLARNGPPEQHERHGRPEGHEAKWTGAVTPRHNHFPFWASLSAVLLLLTRHVITVSGIPHGGAEKGSGWIGVGWRGGGNRLLESRWSNTPGRGSAGLGILFCMIFRWCWREGVSKSCQYVCKHEKWPHEKATTTPWPERLG